MNSFKKFFFSLTLLTLLQAFNILTANGQDSQQYDFSAVRINGLDIDKIHTREQIIDALGEPDEEDNVIYKYFVYHTTMVMAPASEPIENGFRAAENVTDDFGYYDDGNDSIKICVFTLNSDRFAINDYIRVGDPVTKVYDMGGKTLEEEDRNRIYWAPEGSPDDPQIEWDCYPAFWYDKNGIITKIELYYD